MADAFLGDGGYSGRLDESPMNTGDIQNMWLGATNVQPMHQQGDVIGLSMMPLPMPAESPYTSGGHGGEHEEDLLDDLEDATAGQPMQQPMQQHGDVSGSMPLPPLPPMTTDTPAMTDLMDQLGGDLPITGITLNSAGELEVSDRYVVSCHQPPWRNTNCPATGEHIKNCGGVGHHAASMKRNAYWCKICEGSAWSQIHPSLMQPGQDPKIDNNCKKAVLPDDPRRSNGYRHDKRTGGCGLIKRKELAEKAGEQPCTCIKKKPKETDATDEADSMELQALVPVQCSHLKCQITACLRCAGFQDEASADEFMKQEKWCCVLHDSKHRHAWHCADCDFMISDITDRNLTEAVSCGECEQWFCEKCVGFKSCKTWSAATRKKWGVMAESFVCRHCSQKKPKKKR